MSFKWLLCGVGRSGTTAMYVAMQHLARAQGHDFQCRYEPYLWGPPTWSTNFREAASRFTSTTSINPVGLATHLTTPLFLRHAPHPEHSRFVSTIFPRNISVLAKVIRACGRLDDYLRYDEDLKIVHVMRNPLDSVNSILGLFSFFGDEFHPSDKSRFYDEIGLDVDRQARLCHEAQASVDWWYFMNEAALETAGRFPDRILVVPYETFTAAPSATFEGIASFLGGSIDGVADIDLDRPGGPVTKKVNLKSQDIETLREYHDWYFAEIADLSSVPIHFDPTERANKVADKYKSAESGRFVPVIPRDESPLLVRQRYLKALSRTGFRERLARDAQPAIREISADPWRWSRAVARRILRLIRAVPRRILRLTRAVARRILRLTRAVARRILRLTRGCVLRIGVLPSIRLRRRVYAAQSKARLLSSPPSVSCIITSYNNGSDLSRALDSVLGQSLPIEEIIIADDCSEDASRALARSLAKTRNNVKLIERERNRGPGANRHLAILEAKGAFITTLDGDDEFGPDKLKSEWQALGEKLDAVAFSDFMIVGRGWHRTVKQSPRAFSSMSSAERLEAAFSRSVPLPHNMLYSKDVYIRAGGYETQAQLYEDWSFKLRLIHQIEDWRATRAVGLIYHRHGSGLSSAEKSIHAFWRLYALARNIPWLNPALGFDRTMEAIRQATELDDDEVRRRRIGRLVDRSVGSNDMVLLDALMWLARFDDLRTKEGAELIALYERLLTACEMAPAESLAELSENESARPRLPA
jgi:glycosyltransferase involved in cell wall biosynthesis